MYKTYTLYMNIYTCRSTHIYIYTCTDTRTDTSFLYLSLIPVSLTHTHTRTAGVWAASGCVFFEKRSFPKCRSYK